VRKWNADKKFIGRSGYFLVPLLLTLAFFVTFSTVNEACTTGRPTNQPNNGIFCFFIHSPGDNALPYDFAINVAKGQPTAMLADWHLTDRPPLQVGMALGADLLAAGSGYTLQVYTSAATFYQLSWIGALFGLLVMMRVRLKNIITIIGVIGLSSFVFINSIFVWPKFYSASLVILGITMLFLADKRINSRYLPVAMAAISLGMLAHMGVVFTAIGVAIVFAAYYFKNFGFNLRSKDFIYLAMSCLLALLLLGPWFIYKQKVEPIDFLTKYQLAGVTDASDTRGTFKTIVDEYHELSFPTWLDDKGKNLLTLVNPFGTYVAVRNPGESNLAYFARFIEQANFYILIASVGVLNMGWLALIKKRWREQTSRGEVLTWAACGVGLLFWVLAMIVPEATINHQGSYAANLLIMVLLGVFVTRINHKWLLLLLGVQSTMFAFVWLISPNYTRYQDGAMHIVQFIVLGLLLLALYQLPKYKFAKELT
jgi:hypothetical protein